MIGHDRQATPTASVHLLEEFVGGVFIAVVLHLVELSLLGGQHGVNLLQTGTGQTTLLTEPSFTFSSQSGFFVVVNSPKVVLNLFYSTEAEYKDVCPWAGSHLYDAMADGPIRSPAHQQQADHHHHGDRHGHHQQPHHGPAVEGLQGVRLLRREQGKHKEEREEEQRQC